MIKIHSDIQNFIKSLIKLVGIDSVVSESLLKKPDETDWRNRFYGESIAVVFPTSTEIVVKVVEFCNNSNISIIPQGGNTSLCGGSVPLTKSNKLQLILNLSKMNKILGFNHQNNIITVEAGCTLQTVANYANGNSLYFPLNIASKGSCQIGGNIATNAGGIHVIKYGTMRNLVLGLEAVLSDGTIVNQLNQLHKNNTNFDLKQLFIGSEGTLGIITKANLALYPQPLAFFTGFIGVDSIIQALDILNQFKAKSDICAFEIINKEAQDLYNNTFKNKQIPIQHEWVILFEAELFDLDITNNDYQIAQDKITLALISILQKQKINLDHIIIANNNKEREEFWHIRENIPLVEKTSGVAIKHDIAIPLNQISSFINKNIQNLDKNDALSKIPHKKIIFGHLGDGNLHYNIQFFTHDKLLIEKLEPEINQMVYDDLTEFGGTFSAEHGIGQLKTLCYQKYCDPASYKIAKQIKILLDPKSLLNPAKIFM